MLLLSTLSCPFCARMLLKSAYMCHVKNTLSMLNHTTNPILSQWVSSNMSIEWGQAPIKIPIVWIELDLIVETLRYTCVQISPPWFASLRSEEVVTGKSAWGNFLTMVVMETVKYTCVPSFNSMHCMICKKWRSSYGKKCLRTFFHGCHGNAENTKFHFHALHGLQVWEVKK